MEGKDNCLIGGQVKTLNFFKKNVDHHHENTLSCAG